MVYLLGTALIGSKDYLKYGVYILKRMCTLGLNVNIKQNVWDSLVVENLNYPVGEKTDNT